MAASESDRQHLRELLREIRTEAGLKQSDLAQRLGKPQSYVSKYESGERKLDFVEVRQVCQAAGVHFMDFVRRFEGTSGTSHQAD